MCRVDRGRTTRGWAVAGARVDPLGDCRRTVMTTQAARKLAVAAVIGGLLIGGVRSSAQSLSERQTTRAVQRALERLPYYGVFDFIAFQVDRGTVTLSGYAYHGSLKNAA